MQDVICPFCQATNPRDGYICDNCERSLIVGKLTSLGRGVLTKGLVWDLRPCSHTMGRNIGNDFVVPSNLISGKHMQFVYRNGKFYVEDTSERGNCFVNDAQVENELGLQNACTLRVGVEEFLFTQVKLDSNKVTKVPDPLAGQLQLMLGIISEFHASLNLQEVVDNAVDAVLRLTHTNRGYAFLVEETPDGEMDLREVSARESGGKILSQGESNEYTISQSIIQQVLQGNGSIIIEDAMQQNVNTDTIRKFKLKSIICLPLVTYNYRTGQKQVMGIIYADSLMPTGELPKHCRSTLQMLAEIITSTIVKWQNYDKMEQTFGKYQRCVNQVEMDLQATTDQILYLQEMINEPEKYSKISREEINLELNAVESRIQSIWSSLKRLNMAND
ncbi:MAG: FHA domain-containing protein [Lentisphaeria bacterium]|nr:FHA domain-containing protein [Lentisphaeria bacterium]NQZ69858.1 FHA domain-containing protein [Lentisphaeria bacterium]